MAKRGIAGTRRLPAPSPSGRWKGAAANAAFEAKLRNDMDAAEYKQVVPRLIFLKYVSDTFKEHQAKLVAEKGEFEETGPEERDEYVAVMDLAIRGIETDFALEQADTFQRDLHKDLKARSILANPPFNESDWHRVDDDARWQYGVPPKSNSNLAWVQYFIHHLASNLRPLQLC